MLSSSSRVALAALCLASAPAAAAPPVLDASAVFRDGPNGEKIHIASGFVCPVHVGRFVRDAVGERDLATHTDFCSYYGFDGVYGTLTIGPQTGAYDPLQSLAPKFEQEEAIAAKQVAQGTLAFAAKPAPLAVFSRAYETSHLETLHYRIAFTGAAVSGWVVETATEYAEPRDNAVQQAFLNWVYGSAVGALGTGAPK